MLRTRGGDEVLGSQLKFADYIMIGALKNEEVLWGHDPQESNSDLSEGIFPGEFRDYIESFGHLSIKKHYGYTNEISISKIMDHLSEGSTVASLVYTLQFDENPKSDGSKKKTNGMYSGVGIHYVIIRDIIKLEELDQNGNNYYMLNYSDYESVTGKANKSLKVTKENLEEGIKNVWILE